MEKKRDDIIGEEARCLFGTLVRIKDRSQKLFSNPLEIDYCEPDISASCELDPYALTANPSYFYISEVKKGWFWGILPLRKERRLFTIDADFYAIYSKKEINCDVSDSSILDIVKEELQIYADALQITTINILQHQGKSD